jgi:hypothetical protein
LQKWKACKFVTFDCSRACLVLTGILTKWHHTINDSCHAENAFIRSLCITLRYMFCPQINNLNEHKKGGCTFNFCCCFTLLLKIPKYNVRICWFLILTMLRTMELQLARRCHSRKHKVSIIFWRCFSIDSIVCLFLNLLHSNKISWNNHT